MLIRLQSVALGAFVTFLLLPVFSYAQTNVTDTVVDTVTGIVNDKFKEETGLDKVEDLTNIDAGALADKTVEYIRGEVPSQVMANLIKQLRGEDGGEGLSSSFKLFTIKTQNRNAPYFTENACVRIANQRLMEGLFNAKVKAHFSPWVDIAWTAVKSIADGGKSLGDLIAEHTKEKVEGLIQEALFGAPEPEVEIVTIPHHDRCGSVTTITWDPVNKRVIVVTTGNCQCRRITSKWENESDTLEGFKVVLVAPVTVTNVRINEQTRFGGYLGEWVGKTYDIQAQYKVGKLNVTTEADCDCSDYVPPEDDDTGLLDGIIDWITGWFDPSGEPEDRTDPPEDEGEGEEGEGSGEAGESGEGDTGGTEPSGLGGFISGLFGGDRVDEPEDQPEPEGEGDDNGGTSEEPEDKPLVCGDAIDIDGRSSVPTHVYRDPETDEVNLCDRACLPHQECHIVPESVGAYRDSCTYCKDICQQGEFNHQAACERAANPDQICVATGVSKCHRLEDKKKPTPPPPIRGGNCEEAVRLLLDEYMGWFDPPVTFSADGAVFLNGPYRCFGPDTYEEHHRSLVNEGVADAQVKAMCPSLRHVSSEEIHLGGEGKGATCNSKTIFTF